MQSSARGKCALPLCFVYQSHLDKTYIDRILKNNDEERTGGQGKAWNSADNESERDWEHPLGPKDHHEDTGRED